MHTASIVARDPDTGEMVDLLTVGDESLERILALQECDSAQ